MKALSFFLSQAVVYEKPGFEGNFLEIDSDVFSFCDNAGGISAEGTILGSKKPTSVGSLKIMGGLWVFILPLRSPLSVMAQNEVGNLCLGWWFWGYVIHPQFKKNKIKKYSSNQQHCCTLFLLVGWATVSLGLRGNSTSWRKASSLIAATGEAQSSSHWDQYCLWVPHCLLQLVFACNGLHNRTNSMFPSNNLISDLKTIQRLSGKRRLST